MNTNEKKRGIPYYVVIVACCFLMTFTALGFGSSPKKLFIVAVPKAMGFDYGPYSIGDSCRFIATAVMNLFFGFFVTKLGPRKMIACGFASLVSSMLLYSVAESLIVIYIAGVLLGMGLSFTGTLMASYAVNIWCKERKGTMLGLVLCANGLGGAVSMQVLSPIINASTFGYRDAYRLVALIMTVVCVLIVLFFRNAPEGTELPGMAKKKAKGDAWEGITFRQALRKPYFYVAAVCVLLTGMVLQSITGVDANHVDKVGLDKTVVASILSIHSLALMGFKFLVGVIHDKGGLRKTMLVCDAAAIVSILLLFGVTNSAVGTAMFGAYSVLSSLALPLETIMLPLITAELFGQKSYAQMLGIISAINTAGYALGLPAANFVFDAIGSYRPVFLASATIMLAITISFMFVLTAARKDREKMA